MIEDWGVMTFNLTSSKGFFIQTFILDRCQAGETYDADFTQWIVNFLEIVHADGAVSILVHKAESLFAQFW